MKPDVKIVFFDIDGTIYDMQRGVPESTVEAVRLLRKKGHIPVVCTGRPRCTVFPEITDLDFAGVIAGAGTFLEYDGKVLRDQELPEEQIWRTLELLRQAEAPALLEGTRYLCYDPEECTADTFHILRRMLEEYPERLRPVRTPLEAGKITVLRKDRARFDAFRPALSEDYTIISYETTPYAELVPKGMSKAQGIEDLIRFLGLPREATIAFGDGPNDLEMLRYAAYGIAMGNSEQHVLETAEYRTDPMWQDGIWNALKRMGCI